MPPLLRAFLLECGRTLVRLVAYCAVLAGLGLGAVQVYAALPADPAPPPPASEWMELPRAPVAFELQLGDFIDFTPQALARRHVHGGGRRDLLIWEGENPRAPRFAIELYRPGTEALEDGNAPFAALDSGEEEMPSKFGPFALSPAAPAAAKGARCLYFHRSFAEPTLQIAGIACGGGREAALRALIACGLDRLSLVSAGGDARLARLFAHADLKRSTCGPGRLPAAAVPPRGAWIDAARPPALRR